MLRFDKHSGIYSLHTEQKLNCSLEEAWLFFSDPKNLEVITPDDLSFRITSTEIEEMFKGQIITYRIGLFPGISSNWVTEITAVQKEQYFIDEQRFGPYSMWHHLHAFEVLEDGTVLMKDKVHFKPPLGVLGKLAYGLFIKKKLKGIFEFRFEKLEKLFNS